MPPSKLKKSQQHLLLKTWKQSTSTLIFVIAFQNGKSPDRSGHYKGNYIQLLSTLLTGSVRLHAEFGSSSVVSSGQILNHQKAPMNVVLYMMNYGEFLPVWISQSNKNYPIPFAFDSPEVRILPADRRNLKLHFPSICQNRSYIPDSPAIP